MAEIDEAMPAGTPIADADLANASGGLSELATRSVAWINCPDCGMVIGHAVDLYDGTSIMTCTCGRTDVELADGPYCP